MKKVGDWRITVSRYELRAWRWTVERHVTWAGGGSEWKEESHGKKIGKNRAIRDARNHVPIETIITC